MKYLEQILDEFSQRRGVGLVKNTDTLSEAGDFSEDAAKRYWAIQGAKFQAPEPKDARLLRIKRAYQGEKPAVEWPDGSITVYCEGMENRMHYASLSAALDDGWEVKRG